MIGDIIKQIDVCYKAMARINNGTVTVGMVIGPNTRTFLCEMEKLAKLLLSIESAIGSEIKNDVKMILTSSIIHPFAYGRLQAYLKCISAKYNREGGKKVFISHSSKDAKIVDAFVTLLIRGAGLSQDDIFCTSIDGMKISNGNDLREHIHNNINSADFAILLVSKNYKKSEVCLNEMGAVWAVDKKIKAYVFPDFKEENVGWLINNKAIERINDTTALASLYQDIQSYYNLPIALPQWAAQAEAFRKYF